MDSSRRSFVLGAGIAVGAQRLAGAPITLAQKLAHEWMRPQYHLLPAANWMNDPNAPLYFRGIYHMFYQYNPNGAFWGTMHWGHATSRDMIHWKHQPVALAPTPGGPDKDGVFSGSAVVNNGVPTLLYTGVKPEVQCLATSRDPQLNKWEKFAGNPVIAAPPEGLAVTGFRDPSVWREGSKWMMALGSGRKGIGGLVLLYESADLVHWTYLHPLFEGSMDAQSTKNDVVGTGEMWECPDFFPLDGRHVLLISTKGKVYWWVGQYREQKFVPETEGVADYGAYYAAKSMVDAKGRRILWGWVKETRPLEAYRETGWAGAMALPRVLAVGAGNRLVSTPLPELASLRDTDAAVIQGAQHVAANATVALPVYGVETAEFLVEFGPPAGEVGLLFSPGRNPLELIYDPGRKEVRIGIEKAPCALSPGEALRLHLFYDGSVMELFVNERVVVTARDYAPGMDTAAILARGKSAQVRKVQFWPVKPISGDRLTT